MKLIDLLAAEIRASADYNSNVQQAPCVILWPDKQRQWESALPLLQAALPELIVHGEYAPELKRGPAIWIKCVIERVLPEVEIPEGKTPIVYLPGVERRDLRAIASCPDFLMPLAELQYRGCWWIYNNSGRDWTVKAFLMSSNGGAGLDVANDQKTQQAMQLVLTEILESRREDLADRRLEAPDFNKLVSSDPTRDLLSWMNDPKASLERWGAARWQAFVSICETEYRFSPERDGELMAAELLCQRQGVWEGVWQRYEESCHHYPHLPELLLKAQPDLGADSASYPLINQREEESLQQELESLQTLAPEQVRAKLLALEERHGSRRGWLWSRLDMAPLAGVLEYLSVLAEITDRVFSGADPEEMAELYRERYWRADDLALKVLAFPSSSVHQTLTQNLLGLIYTPWLDDVTSNFQRLVKTKGYPRKKPGPDQCQEPSADYTVGGELVFFVDGLRYDLARRLLSLLQPLGKAQLYTSWAALPSVTATAKAAVTPVQDRLTGRLTDRDFVPSLGDGDKSFSAYYLRKFLREKGWQYLEEGESGDPSRNAWVQSGDIDKEGHVRGIKLAARVDGLLQEVVERVEELLAAGWPRIRIVTDHGWMLTPQAMAKVDLPKYLTETRWGRCAAIKDSVTSEYQQVGWYWNNDVSIAMAPGASCFKAGQYYDHGGLSLQECVTPVIELIADQVVRSQRSVTATLSDLRWLGLTCRVRAETSAGGVMAVLRAHAADASTELCGRKPIKEGRCTLMVDDEHEGASAVLVLLDEQGNVLAKKPTTVGED